MPDKVLIQHFEKVPAFIATARLGSIRKAAEALAMSQPALSQTLKRLEDILETTLFTRSRLGIKLTSEGESFFESAQKIIENIDLLELRIRKKENKEIKKLRIGTHETLAIHLWPELIEAYQEKKSNHLISITSGRIDLLTQQVQRREIDLILTVTPKVLNKLKTVRLYSDDFAFYVSPKFKRVKKKILNLQDLVEFPILTDCHAHLAQDRPVLREMSKLGLYSSSYYQLNSFEASIRLAEKGLGVAFLPKRIVQNLKPRISISKLKVRGIPKDHFKHHICATFLDGHSLAEDMVKFVHTQVRQ